MNQKLKKILTKSLIIFGILIPTVTVSTSLVLSCSSSNDQGGNPNGNGGSGGPNGGGSSGGSGSNGGSGTGDSVNQKHVLNFESKLMADPSSGQKQVQFDIENQDAGAIYFESQQKEQELLQLFQDVKDNKIMWINEETLEPIKYEFTMTLKQGMSIGYSDILETVSWDYVTNCYKNVAVNGDITIKIPFQVDNQFYDGSIAPQASDFRYLMNVDKSDQLNNPSGIENGKISYSFFPPMKDWYIFTDGSYPNNRYWSYCLTVNTEKSINNLNRIFMSINYKPNNFDTSNMNFDKFINDYHVYDASQDSSIFTDNTNLNRNKFYVPSEISAQHFNGNAYIPNDNLCYSKYKFDNKSTNIGTFSIKQIQ